MALRYTPPFRMGQPLPESPKSAENRGSGLAWELRLWGGGWLGAGPRGRLGRIREMDAKKPQVGKMDVAVTVLDRLLGKMRMVILVGTILVICLVVCAMAYYLSTKGQ